VPEPEPSAIAQRILRYFVRNSEAADTFEGIVRWRLREEAIHQTSKETHEALAWLVAHGFLREVPIARGPPLFQLNADKRAEAEAVLATERTSEPGSPEQR